MILWNRELSCNRNTTSDSRRAVAKTIATSDVCFYANFANYIINFVVMAITYMAFGFNLIALAIAFVTTDFVLTIADNLMFVYIPRWRTLNSSLKTSQKRVKKVTAKRDALLAKIQKFKDNECASCTSRHSWRSKCCDCYEKETQDLRIMDTFIKEEQRWIDSQLEKIKEEEIQEDTRQSKDFADKTEYFVATSDKIEYFAKTYKVEFLNDVIGSLDLLNDTLAKKPIGYTLIPGTMYAYLDELQNILNKWVDLDDVQKKIYEADISKISVAIGNFITSLNNRIVRLETEDIEVGISVLLSELEENLEEENKNV